MGRHKLIVLDRDGVINADSDDYIKSEDEWEPLPGASGTHRFEYMSVSP